MAFKMRFKQGVRSALRTLHLVALISSFLFTPVADALQIEIKSRMNLRALRNNELRVVATLAAGSIVEIPDEFRVKRGGKTDAKASFDKWAREGAAEGGYSESDVTKPVTNSKLDFYFKVKIKKMAKGSKGPRSLVGKTHYMALRVLSKSRGGLRVIENSPVYAGPSDKTPLKPLDPSEAATETASATTSAPPAETELAASGTCMSCVGTTNAPAGAELLQQTTQTLEQQTLPEAFNAEASAGNFQKLSRGFPPTCQAFIRSNGSYGEFGQELLQQIGTDPRYFRDSNGTSKICPRWSTFSDSQKRHFWVWVFASMASQESTCTLKAKNRRCPNGTCAGLYQIEESADLRAGRGSKCDGNPYSLRTNTRCAVSMLGNILDGRGPSDWSGNYWSTLRGRGTKARQRIRQYQDCFSGGAR